LIWHCNMPERRDKMKIMPTAAAQAVHFDSDVARGVTGRVVIGRIDGANNFCMRRFDLAPGGHTPRHAHAWEHEIFFHAGEAEVLSAGEWIRVAAGDAVFVPGDEEHQIRNAGDSGLTFICLVPAGAPEI
jgi:quercetin dioxygenase-like cupin family protein